MQLRQQVIHQLLLPNLKLWLVKTTEGPTVILYRKFPIYLWASLFVCFKSQELTLLFYWEGEGSNCSPSSTWQIEKFSVILTPEYDTTPCAHNQLLIPQDTQLEMLAMNAAVHSLGYLPFISVIITNSFFIIELMEHALRYNLSQILRKQHPDGTQKQLCLHSQNGFGWKGS